MGDDDSKKDNNQNNTNGGAAELGLGIVLAIGGIIFHTLFG